MVSMFVAVFSKKSPKETRVAHYYLRGKQRKRLGWARPGQEWLKAYRNFFFVLVIVLHTAKNDECKNGDQSMNLKTKRTNLLVKSEQRLTCSSSGLGDTNILMEHKFGKPGQNWAPFYFFSRGGSVRGGLHENKLQNKTTKQHTFWITNADHERYLRQAGDRQDEEQLRKDTDWTRVEFVRDCICVWIRP